MNDKERYLTYPIVINQQILNDISNPKSVMLDILWYGIRRCSLTFDDDEITNFNKALKFMGLVPASVTSALARAKRLEKEYQDEKVFVSVSKDIVYDFAKNDKTEFEVACFLGYSSTKSILGSKPYMKITNDYFLARFFGFSSTAHFAIGVKEPSVFAKYEKLANRYQLDKIKEELRDNWGLKLYARYTRGFYVSYKLKYSELVCYAELNRKAVKVKRRKQEEAKALASVLAFIEKEDA